MGLSRNCEKHHPGLVGVIVVFALMFPRGADARSFLCAAGDVLCLIQSINEANTNGQSRNTIHLDAGTYVLLSVDNVTDGANGLPSITSTLKIDAPRNEMATITGGGLGFRLLHVAASGHLTLERITLTGGGSFGLNGGGVFNNGGQVIIRESAFIENEASTAGGLSNLKGKVTVRSSTFLKNVAFSGGGLANDGGEVTIVDSMFERNESGLTGGALRNQSQGILNIKRSHITGNRGGSVGGILNGGFGSIEAGALLIEETTFSGNTGEEAGAIWARPGGTMVVKDSAFVENGLVSFPGSGTFGAAILNGGTAAVTNTTFGHNGQLGPVGPLAGALAIHNDGTLVLTNSTFAGHTGGIFLEPILSSGQNATTLLLNTILTHRSEDPTIQECVGPIISLGHNLISDPTGCAVTLQPTDMTGDAGLDAFIDDGTPGNGHFPLLKDSQAIDAGNDVFCPKRDQISEERHGQCDIGAIEFQPKKHGHHEKHDHKHDKRDDSSPLD